MDRRPVIFDCDGVLVDSEALSWEAWRRVVDLYGVEITDSDIVQLTGRTYRSVYSALRDRGELAQSQVDERDVLASVRALVTTLFEEKLEAFEDAEDTADHLKRIGYRLAVASSSFTDRVELSLGLTNLRDLFEVVVGGDKAANSKPSPDLYLVAARELGVDPTTCVAVEDSPAGISSAKAAGMRVVAVNRGFFPAAAIAHADVVVPSLTPAVFLG